MKNELKNKIIYQAFIRNYTEEGTFKSFINKLDYIKSLGVDIIYSLPINEIGLLNRKGNLGSPYSIKDYLKINEEYGTMEDFKELINECHKRDLKIMIDIVFNHTSKDSYIVNNHPEWMYRNEDGEFANKIGDWSDVSDLDYSKDNGLIEYLVDVIDFYSSIGVDGYRFDVASLIDKKFYISLKKMLDEKYNDTILLGESVDVGFTNYARELGYNSLSDAELYILGFDLLYGYNTYYYIDKFLETHETIYLDYYKALLNSEEGYNPEGNLRIRGLENHDRLRICEYTQVKKLQKNIAASQVFLKGPMFIYNGLETMADHRLDLFDKDPLDLTIDKEWFDFIKQLISFKKSKKNLSLRTSETLLTKGQNLAIINHYDDGSKSYGLFSYSTNPAGVIIKDEKLVDGAYVDYFTNKIYLIKNNSIRVKEPLYLFQASDLD